MPTKKKETWFVVADGMRARILRRTDDRRLVPATDHDLYDAAVHGFARDLKSDAPGRVFDTGSGARHAVEPRHDPHEFEKERFGKYVASVINEAAARDAFEQLVLVAPPRALGVLRAALDERARGRILEEVPKDLTRAPLDRLAEHLAGIRGA